MIPRHPYFRPAKLEQHETARQRMEREARDFLRQKAILRQKLAGHRLIPAAA